MNVVRTQRKLIKSRKKRRYKHLPKNYFKYPIGKISSNIHYDFSAEESLCASIVAFCYSYLLPESSWSDNFLNEMFLLVLEGKLVVDSKGDLLDVTRTLQLDNYTFEVQVTEICSGIVSEEIDTCFSDLKKSFSGRKCLLFIFEEESVIIWTKDDPNHPYGYFTFMPNKNTLLLVGHLKDLASSLRILFKSGTSYRISEISVTRLEQIIHEDGDHGKLPGRGFVIVNDNMAILKGTQSLKPPSKSNIPGNRGLFVGYTAAILANKFSLNSWDSDDLDRVILLSENLSRKALGVNQNKFSYLVSCGPYQSYLDTETAFYAEFEEVLEDIRRIERILKHRYAIIIEYQSFYWTIMQQNLFYFLNPYDYSEKDHFGRASLQMHLKLDDILEILLKLAQESTRVTLHAVKIKSVEEKITSEKSSRLENLLQKAEHLNETKSSITQFRSEGKGVNLSKSSRSKKKLSPQEAKFLEVFKEFSSQSASEKNWFVPESKSLEIFDKIGNPLGIGRDLSTLTVKSLDIMDETGHKFPTEKEASQKGGDVEEAIKQSASKQDVTSSEVINEVINQLINREGNEKHESKLKRMTRRMKHRMKQIKSKLKRVRRGKSRQVTGGVEGNQEGFESNSESEEASETLSTLSGESEIENLHQNSPEYHLTDIESKTPEESIQEQETVEAIDDTIHDPTLVYDASEMETDLEGMPETGATYDIKQEPIRKDSVAESILSQSYNLETKSENLIILQSATGSEISLNKLIRKGLTLSNRLFIATPGKRFAVLHHARYLYLYRGCVCKIPLLPKEVTNEEMFWRFMTICKLVQAILDINRQIEKSTS